MGTYREWAGNLGFLLALGGVGCGSADDGPGPRPDPVTSDTVTEAKSDLARSAPDAAPDSVASRVAGDTAFAIELYRKIAAGEGAQQNRFFSPYSISLALGMLYPGAGGTTKTEMQKVLHFDQPDDEVAHAFNTLEQALASRGANASGTNGQPFRLASANALWGQDGQAFLEPYLDVLAVNYGAGVNLVDFGHDPEAARLTINDWVSQKTAQKIPELLPNGSINSLTAFVLTNAIYFNAAWATQFDETLTQDGTFTLADGSAAELPLMHGVLTTRYAEGGGWKATEFPHSGGEVSMLLVLPDAGTFDTFQSGLDPSKFAGIGAALEASSYVPVVVTLPKFEVRTPLLLAEALTDLGMPTAFIDGAADLSGIDGTHDLYISAVIHQAFAKVDEGGTEAAAATAVIGSTVSIATDPPPVPKQFDVRQPFLFGIRDNATGELLFLGQIADPRG